MFADAEELAVLTGKITGPAIEATLVERARTHLNSDDVVVLEAATILGGVRRIYGMEGVIHVDVPAETAFARFVARGMAEADARARMAKQVGGKIRLQHADFVIDNSGSAEELEPQIDAAWMWIAASSRRRATRAAALTRRRPKRPAHLDTVPPGSRSGRARRRRCCTTRCTTSEGLVKAQVR